MRDGKAARQVLISAVHTYPGNPYYMPITASRQGSHQVIFQ